MTKTSIIAVLVLAFVLSIMGASLSALGLEANEPSDQPQEGNVLADAVVKVEAESFSAYSDGTPGNLGSASCRSDAPNADMKPVGSGGCTIGWLDPGDWYEWTVTVPDADTYTMDIAYINGETRSTSVLFVSDGQRLSNTSLPPTGSWNTISTATVGSIDLKAGENTIRFNQAGFIDIDYFRLTSGGTPAPTPTPSPTPSTPTGNFYIVGKDIVDPDGNIFIPVGANAALKLFDFSYVFEGNNGGANQHIQEVKDWNWNTIRATLICDNDDFSNPDRPSLDQLMDGLKREIPKLTSEKIVVMVECHDVTGQNPALGSAKELKIREFWDRMAVEFKDNPYVWFNFFNEPWNTAPNGSYTDIHDFYIKRLRATGAQNIAVVDAPTWGQGLEYFAETDLASNLAANQCNVMFSWHAYGAFKGRQGSAAEFENAIKQVQARNLALVVGEYGIAFPPENGNAGPWQWNVSGFNDASQIAPRYDVGVLWWIGTGDNSNFLSYSLKSTRGGYWDGGAGSNLTGPGQTFWNLSQSYSSPGEFNGNLNDSGCQIQTTPTPDPAPDPDPDPIPTPDPTTTVTCPATQPLELEVNAQDAVEFNVWVRAQLPRALSLSRLYIESNGVCSEMSAPGAIGAWNWVSPDEKISLAQGEQVVNLYLPDGEVWVDKLLVTLDDGCIPEDDGSNCNGDPIDAGIIGIEQGEVVRDSIVVFAGVNGSISDSANVVFTIDDEIISENIKSDAGTFCLAELVNGACGSYDFRLLSEGAHTLTLTVSDGGVTVSSTRDFTVDAPDPDPDPDPTTGTPIKIEAESFTDYNDGSLGNNGNSTCRTDAPNADMKAIGSGDCTIGWIDPGDWYEWTVDALEAGSYDLSLTYVNGEINSTGAQFLVDGSVQINATNIPSTGVWSQPNLTSLSIGRLQLDNGVNTIRFQQMGFIDLDYLTLTPDVVVEPTPTPTPEPTPDPTPTPDPDPTPTPTPGQIKIRARGTTGSENIILKINNKQVASYQDLSTSMTEYTHQVEQPTTIDTIRIHFNEDGNFKGEDKNVIVDYLEIDGIRYETEAPSVYSKGVWTSSSGCRKGFKQHDWLACNGWIEYRDAKGLKLASSGETAAQATSAVVEAILRSESRTEVQTIVLGSDFVSTENGVKENVIVTVPQEEIAVVGTDTGMIEYTVDGEPAGVTTLEDPELNIDTEQYDDGEKEIVGVITGDNGRQQQIKISIEFNNDVNQLNEAKENSVPILVIGSGTVPKATIRGQLIITVPLSEIASSDGTIVYTLDGAILATATAENPEIVVDTADLKSKTYSFGASVLGASGEIKEIQLDAKVDNSPVQAFKVWASQPAVKGVMTVLTLGFAVTVAYPKARRYILIRRQNSIVVGSPQPISPSSFFGRLSASSGSYATATVVALLVTGGAVLAAPATIDFTGNTSIFIEAENTKSSDAYQTAIDSSVTPAVSYVELSLDAEPTPDPDPTPDPSPTPDPISSDPIKVEAESFSAYDDNSPGNNGNGTCRPDAPNADLKATGSGCTIGWINPGDWYEWTVNVPSAGTYTLDIRYINGEASATAMRFLVAGAQQLYATNIAPTGNWDTFSTASIGTVTLSEGNNTIRFEQTGFVDLDYFTLTPGGTPSPTPDPSPSPNPNPNPTSYQESLNLIRTFSRRNTLEDNSPYRDTPSAELYDKTDLYGPHTNYTQGRGGYNQSEWFEREYFPGNGAGTFRSSCEVSHFSYDDPIVFPGQPGAAHLHMFLGNTDTNAYSTYDTILNSGGSTCNGGELNRTAYWVPAMFDGKGSVVVPSKVKFYYKTEFPAGIGKVQTYPDNLQIVGDNTNNVNGNLHLSTFRCNNIYNGGKSNGLNTIPTCFSPSPAGFTGVLEYQIYFDYCWNGNRNTIGDWQANAGVNGQAGNLVPPLNFWHSSVCPSSHPNLLPALVTHIFYDIKDGENTSNWFMSSDVNPNTGLVDKPRGSTAHADWFGGWNKQVNQEWVNNCSNKQNAECAAGMLADPSMVSNPRSLRLRNDWITGNASPNARIPVSEIFDHMCQYDKPLSAANGASQGAYCRQ